ncbi:MAG: cytochrome c-type biogenesis protein CcmH [Ardenticatenaceae bacterium]|nr:cytochrome c-type biogenesis protein CcmH [Anaerolineales bacterium]MCB8923210.1 cytochrome c-type biogenesis protein CcmH [Ardenticatenaceae bacterium]MCB9004845.1 cytochrome c-type biogenesis protein CcmH [Ardenticatenaceae bacterium]
MKTSRITLYILLLIVIMLMALPVFAQDSDTTTITDDQVNEVAKEVYCPVCESTPLDVCETQACADWRELIRTKLANGESQQDIFDYFAEQYGDRVLATPPARGLNWLIWTWPFIALIGGAYIFVRLLRGMRRAAVGEASPTTTSVDSPSPTVEADDYVNRIEKELRGEQDKL